MRTACVTVCPPAAPIALALPEVRCCIEYPPTPVVLPVVAKPISVVQNAADVVRITFDNAITADPQVDPAAFSVTLGASGVHVVTASSSGNQVNLVLSGPATFTTGTVTYAPTGTGDLVSAATETPVAGFTRPVTPL